MKLFYKILFAAFFSINVLCCVNSASAASDAEWQAMTGYEYGQDMKPLLAIDCEAIKAMNSLPKREAMAGRLADLLTDKATTLAAKQFICQKLQALGTPAQVPVLAEMMDNPETAEMARMALQQIPADASLEALHAGLKEYRGGLLIGLINSLAARHDAASVGDLKTLADDKDTEIANAAIWALGRIGGPDAVAVISDKVAQTAPPLPRHLAVPYLRCAARLLDEGKTEAAVAIYRRMSSLDESLSSRQAALQGMLNAAGDKRIDTILSWLGESDPLKRQIAAGELNNIEINEAVAQTLTDQLPDMPAAGKTLLMEAMAAKYQKSVRPAVIAAAKSDNAELKQAALRCLATVGDKSSVGLLIAELLNESQFTEPAEQSLVELSGDYVDRAILSAMKNSDATARGRMIDILRRRKSSLAVSELLKEAANDDPAVYQPAVAALRGLASSRDVPDLINLLLKIEQGKHRDEIEKTVMLLCKPSKKGADPAKPVLAAFDKAAAADRLVLLPLLGRLGGKESLDVVAAAIQSDDARMKTAGVRALCNWPDATVADRLLELSENAKAEPQRTWALRAYVRVITLKSDRPEGKTLSMLKHAMTLANADSERRLVIQRAATVRTIETLRWIITYLDDPALSQTACQTIVDLAHHRFLRTPNREEFEKALKKATKLSDNPQTTERAKRYILGL